jgi:hypothetical protein
MIGWERGAALGGVLVALVSFSGGCGSGTSRYIHPDMDFSHIRRCAVLPLQNLTTDPFADERVQSILVMEVLEEGSLEIVGPWETISAMRELGLSSDAALTPAQMKLLGGKLSVDGLLSGTVEEYGVDRAATDRSYEVTLVFALAETEVGSVVWRSQVHRTGSSIWRKLFGGGSASLHDVTRAAVRDALGTLFD